MRRLLFSKTGNAVWISHLDLMRVFQRSFKRAGLYLTHTQGFNQRPSVSIALPLSVGISSMCELLDFELTGNDVSCEEIKERLNAALISGVKVLDVYDQGRKLKELAYLQCRLVLEYDNGAPHNAIESIRNLFSGNSLVVPKRSKNGIQDQDIATMIRKIDVEQPDDCTVEIEAIICCQNPSLNPMQLAAAIDLYLPEYKPNFSKCVRLEVYDREENIFR